MFDGLRELLAEAKFGMQTFNQSLAQAFAKRLITLEEAMGRSSDTEELKNLLSSATARQGAPPQR